MIIEPRFAAVLFAATTGGLLLTASRYRSTPPPQPIAPDILDQVADEQNHNYGHDYNYCQAQRPAVGTYPGPKVEGSTLVNSQLFIRHGDRTPSVVLPRDLDVTWDCANTTAYAFTGIGTDEAEKAPFQYANVVAHQLISIAPESPFASTHMWKGTCIPGQLTPVGAMQHRRLGAALRQIYVDEFKLLPTDFDPESVYIRSTDLWRTRQSAENLMAGLYGVHRHAPDVLPPVLQIHTLPIEIDYLTANTAACPRISHLRYVLENSSPVLKRLEEDNTEFTKELVEILGAEKPWSGYMDTVLPRICHGHPLPCQVTAKGEKKCVTSATADRILKNVNIESTEVYRDAKGVFDVLQLEMGPLVRDIKQNLQKARANGKVRFSFYSGHDTTVLPLLGLLDALDVKWPPYASNILIELWRTPQDKDYVRVIYNGEVLQTKSGWCNLEWCPLETFFEYLDKYIVPDVIALCQTQK